MKTAPSGSTRSYEDHAGETPYFDHVGGMVRNNVIYNDGAHRLETGIELMNVTGTEVYHNTVISVSQPFNCMEYRWENTTVTIKNNLCSHRIMPRNGAQGETEANITDASLSLFVDAGGLDFHLNSDAAAAIDNGVVLAEGKAGVDMDGELRGAQPDIGADERAAATVASPLRVRASVDARPAGPVRAWTVRGRAVGRDGPRGPVPLLRRGDPAPRLLLR
jgi:hypothetical protein